MVSVFKECPRWYENHDLSHSTLVLCPGEGEAKIWLPVTAASAMPAPVFSPVPGGGPVRLSPGVPPALRFSLLCIGPASQ